jgi:hypothetical protein
MKTLDQIIIELEGVWNFKFDELVAFEMTQPPKRLSFPKSEFQQRAKELGFAGRYRWGVEYKTDGKPPELADDVVCQFKHIKFGWGKENEISVVNRWDTVELLKITDQRYKPADTSYLDKPDSSLDNGADWYDYDNQKALRLPPVGDVVECYINTDLGSFRWEKCEVLKHKDATKCAIHALDLGILSWSDEFRPLDHDRKAKADRESFVSAGCKVTDNLRGVFTSDKAAHDVLCALYDAGFRLPD